MTGYSGTPLAKKLGIAAGARLFLHQAPANYRELLAPLPAGVAIWVSWPKKAAGVATDITEQVIRELALPSGLVDIKVCAVDETWSGLKLVIRRTRRTRERS